MKIPGLSFSLKRAVGISAIKQKVSKATGIPSTRQGLERKIGGSLMKAVKGKSKMCLLILVPFVLASCSANFEKMIEEGRYNDAEKILKKMKGIEKYDCAEMLIDEYIDLKEYEKAVNVYEKCTPEHCSNDQLDYPSLYCHGAGDDYELNVTAKFRKVFMETGEYDKVWQYSMWDSSHDNGYNAEAYYQYMNDVILYLCSIGNKAEANRFLNHYVYWFDVKIDNDSYYSTEKPQFLCDVARGKLQRIINTY